MLRLFLLLLLASVINTLGVSAPPNIVLILADDLGFGDLSCYGASKIQTPNCDRLAKEGLRFLDAHSSSATCTPSRYALLTGEYPWRKKGTGILPGDATLIIATNAITLPRILKTAGYSTAVVGKWHLGLGSGTVDWNAEIRPGPLELGFDYSFVLPATGDRVPCVYVENHRVVGLEPKDPLEVSYDRPFEGEATGKSHPGKLKMAASPNHQMSVVNGISRIGYMRGGQKARWVDEDMADTLTSRAVGFVRDHGGSPFFLYFATHDIHVPRVPHARFAGKSSLGVRGDVILQFDWCVGEILNSLEKFGLAPNTLVLLTSDNGPVVNDGYDDGAAEKLDGHKPAGPLRGGKYSIFEGGTRVPLIVRWPGQVQPGVSSALVSQVDFLASLAALAGQKVPSGQAPDSRNHLSALLGKDSKGPKTIVEHSGGLALRDENWKYIEPIRTKNPSNSKKGHAAEPQLYDLSKDLVEQRNAARDNDSRLHKMQSQLSGIRDQLKPGDEQRTK